MPVIDARGNLADIDKSPEILSDDQIEQLLREAESRLQQKSSPALDVTESDNTIKFEEQEITIPTSRRGLKLQHNLNVSSYISVHDGIAKTNPHLLATKQEEAIANELRPVQVGTNSKVNDQTDAGPQWFNLPKTILTPSLKRDLQLIEMRNVLDPHRHYKRNTRSKDQKIPTFSQVGTVIEGPTEWYSGRLNRKDRSKNFVEEAIRGEREGGRFKRKYSEIQETKTSGKKAHYKKLMERRKKKG